jgi:hypothetical protein
MREDSVHIMAKLVVTNSRFSGEHGNRGCFVDNIIFFGIVRFVKFVVN